jgi:hypothetical protein
VVGSRFLFFVVLLEFGIFFVCVTAVGYLSYMGYLLLLVVRGCVLAFLLLVVGFFRRRFGTGSVEL